MNPKLLSDEIIYSGRVFDLTLARIREGDVEYRREIIRHRGSAVIVPVFDDLSVALVRQYRHAAGEDLLEIPAGALEEGESPLIGAKRELEEEIGVTARSWEKLTAFYVSPGFLDELMHVFLASDFTETAQRLDADEFLRVERYSFDSLLEMIRSGEIRDAKTICGVTLAASRFGKTI